MLINASIHINASAMRVRSVWKKAWKASGGVRTPWPLLRTRSELEVERCGATLVGVGERPLAIVVKVVGSQAAWGGERGGYMGSEGLVTGRQTQK